MRKIKIKPQENKVTRKEFDILELLSVNKTKIVNSFFLLVLIIASLFAVWRWQENKKTNAVIILSQADGLFSGGKYEASLNMYKQFVKEFPKHSLAPAAFLGAAYSYEELGNVKEAKKAFSEVKTKFPNSPWTEDAVKGVERLGKRCLTPFS